MMVSIHAPHAGGQRLLLAAILRSRCFNTCPPRGGATRYTSASSPCTAAFQYMPPTRGGNSVSVEYLEDFRVSIHAPHAGGQPYYHRTHRIQDTVSIHAPHAGGQRVVKFCAFKTNVSIHAPHAGGQLPRKCRKSTEIRVSIHAPHAGGQLPAYNVYTQDNRFQYMPPTRGGNLLAVLDGDKINKFQYMPPTRGGNVLMQTSRRLIVSFNTCPPRGGATYFTYFVK